MTPATSGDSVRVLTTGGSIDKIYSLAGQLETGPPAATRILRTARCADDVVVQPVFAKDSLDLDAADRARLADLVAGCAESRVVITHGTDTMVQTARALAADPRLAGKVVVLTGAIHPACMAETDAGFNLGAALAAARCAGTGVWIAMSGNVLAADRAVKDRVAARFVSRPGTLSP